jgi:cytochrome c-type biogenesis protein
MLSRQLLQKARGNMLAAGSRLKAVMGVLLVGLGVLILSHLDKQVETALVEASPEWLTALTTRF